MYSCYTCLRPQVILAHEGDITMTNTLTEQRIPTGTWQLDTVHSTSATRFDHGGVSLFKGGPRARGEPRRRNAARLGRRREHHRPGREPRGPPALARLLRRGAVPARHVRVDLMRRDGDAVTVEGELELSGQSRPIDPDRHDRRPRRGPGGREDRPVARDHDRPHQLRHGLEHGSRPAARSSTTT